MGLPPNDQATYAFILHMLATLKPDTGRMAVLVRYSTLICRDAQRPIRHRLIEANVIDAVICLPRHLVSGLDKSDTLLIMRKNKPDDSIIFIDATSQRGSAQDGVAWVQSLYAARQSVAGHARLMERANVADRNHLAAKFYVHGEM
jgi:type I restriction enzyme M protein